SDRPGPGPVEHRCTPRDAWSRTWPGRASAGLTPQADPDAKTAVNRQSGRAALIPSTSARPCVRSQGGEVPRPTGFKLALATRLEIGKRQLTGMQHLSGEQWMMPPAVKNISQQRIAQRTQMHPDLMR